MYNLFVKKFFNQFASRLHLDVGYFLRGGVYAFFQQSVGITSGLIISYLFGHFVGRAPFGIYNYALSILGFFTFLSLPGIDTALVGSIGKGHDKSYIEGTSAKFKYSLLGIPAVLVVAFYYLLRGNPSLGLALAIAAISFPLLNAFTAFPAFFTAKKMFREHALSASLSSLFYLFIFIIVISFFRNAFGFLVGYLVAISVPSLISHLYAKGFVNLKSTAEKNIVKYGKFLTILNILPWISGNLGSILLGGLMGPESLAVYAVATRFHMTIQKNFYVFYKPATAKLASQTASEHRRTLMQHSGKMLLLGLGLAVLLWTIAPILINFFFTSNYNDSITYARWLSITLIPLPFSWLVSDIIVYQRKKITQVFTSVVFPIFRISLYLLLIPKYGINGLVLTTIIERFSDPIIPVISLVLFRRKGK